MLGMLECKTRGGRLIARWMDGVNQMPQLGLTEQSVPGIACLSSLDGGRV